MTISKASILGILQGLTEFIPISSSGHLVVLQHYLGYSQPMLLFDALLHIATLGVVVAYFRKDLRLITSGLIRLRARGAEEMLGRRIFYLVLVGTLPTAIIGLFFKRWIEALFSMSIFTSLMFLLTGTFLWVGEKAARSGKTIARAGITDALIIGMAQGVAIIPGISRSGATISAALLRGMERESAFRYSFFLSIPAIVGALGLELRESVVKKNLPQEILPYLIGALCAFATGYLSLMALQKALLRKKFSLFAIYCWMIGGGTLILQLFHLK